MLKDIILKKLIEESKYSNKKEDFFSIDLKGSVEIKAWEKGKLFYHDGGDNTVTAWARHSLINLLTGYIHSPIGNQSDGATIRYTMPDPVTGMHDTAADLGTGTSYNKDGNLLSNEQYFWDFSSWENNFDSVFEPPASADFAYYPTKILFGTGKEFAQYSDMNADFQQYYIDNGDYVDGTGYTAAEYFNGTISGQTSCGIADSHNYYSNIINGGTKTLTKTRTVNDITNLALEDADYEYNWGVDGAIKDCYAEEVGITNTNFLTYSDLNLVDVNCRIFDPSSDKINPLFRGLGRPAFIRCRRNGPVKATSSEVCVSTDMDIADDMFENRVTYTAILPEQSAETGDSRFYPYNGMLLKQIGLFNDTNFTISDTIPLNSSLAGWKSYQCMPGGIMMAKRNITPIYKTADVRISVAWTIYTA